MPDTAPYRRWRAALSRRASVVGTARRLLAQISPYTDCAVTISPVSCHTGLTPPLLHMFCRCQRFRARSGSTGTCFGAREEVREIGPGTDVRV